MEALPEAAAAPVSDKHIDMPAPDMTTPAPIIPAHKVIAQKVALPKVVAPKVAALKATEPEIPAAPAVVETQAAAPPVPRQFALLVELDQSIAARTPARQGGRSLRGLTVGPNAPGVPELPLINRAIRTARVPVAPPVAEAGAPETETVEPALLAEVIATLQRRAAPNAASPAARRQRPSRTP